MTPSQILTTIRNQVYETSTAFWTDDEIYQYMWDAECDIAAEVECTETTDSSTTTVSGTQEYTKPTDAIIIQRVTWYGVKLKKISLQDEDQMDYSTYGHTTSTGSPHSYWEYGSSIGLYPTPDDAQTLKYWYIAQPAQITSTSTSFTIPQIFHTSIQDYALWRCYAKDQDDGRASLHRDEYYRKFQRAKFKWMRRNRADRHAVVIDEDYYPQNELGLI